MIRALRLFFILGVFVLLGLTFLTSVRPEPDFLVVVALGAATLGLTVALLTDEIAFFSLGLALCVLPVFGAGVLNLFVLAWLAGIYFLRSLFGFPYVSIDLSGSREIASWAFFLLFLPMLCAVGLTFYAEFDSSLLGSLYRYSGLEGIYTLVSTTAVPWHRALLVASGYVVAGLLFFAVISVQNVVKNTLSLALGTLFGTIFIIGFLIGQLKFEGTWFYLNMTPFWHYVGRYSASFTDPNAFGIMSMLLIPLFIGLSFTRRSRLGFAVGAVLLLFFSVWSGSRTLYLGLALWFLLVVVSAFRHVQRREVQLGAALCVVLFAVTVGLLGYPPINAKVQEILPYPGSQRVLNTLNWEKAREMLSSREIYSRVAYLAWKDSPLTGLGLERFYGQQERIMRAASIDLGGWKDNANNFYLQVLVEQGVLGLTLLAVAIGLFGFAFLSPERRVIVDVDKMEPASVERVFSLSRGILFVLVVALLTGPHLLFDEVRYLTFFLLAVAVSRPIVVPPRMLSAIRAVCAALVLLFPGLFYAAVSSAVERPLSRGFYTPEDSAGVPVAWSTDRGRLYFCDQIGEQAVLRIKALHPDIEKRPVRVALFEREPTEHGPLDLQRLDPTRVVLSDRNWKEVLIPMPKRGLRSISSLEVRVDRVWNPKAAGVGSDPRWLGVMIQWPRESC